MTGIRVSPDWLREPSLVAVFDALAAAGGDVRVNGGAVRNTLMGEPVSDVDLSTDLHPPIVIDALTSAGLKAVPTGIAHGTVTAVSDGVGYEVTTLRKDVETDGRRAVVEFATDWKEDALRRDLTMNALYLDRDGLVHDPLGGLADLRAKQVRFVGDAQTRIREDYLRILRFFRFFAWYGDGRPDAEGLKASAKLKDGLEQLSVERIWAELSKLLAAPDPSRALLWMRTTSVLSKVLPESEKWGIDAMRPLVEAEQAFGWEPDALLRLEAIIPPRADRVNELAQRLKLPNAVRDRLLAWADAPDVETLADSVALRAALYAARKHGHALTDRLKLKAATDADQRSKWVAMLDDAAAFEVPKLPLSGQDLLAAGVAPGKAVGDALDKAEAAWVQSDFARSRDELLSLVAPQ